MQEDKRDDAQVGATAATASAGGAGDTDGAGGAGNPASRSVSVSRQTKETSIEVSLDLDGDGATSIATGIGFFDHMLDALGRHGLLGLRVSARGDLQVDGHHTVEDTGIVLGGAVAKALGGKAGIRRYGEAIVPMDESLVLAAIDISGRGRLYWDVQAPQQMLGDFDTALAKEFFDAFAANAQITLHIRQLAGENAHHILEACFKAVARALRQATEPDPRVFGEVPSTKGSL